MTNQTTRSTLILLLAAGGSLLLSGCGMVGDAEARNLEDQLETGQPAPHYVERLQEQGYEVGLAERSSGQLTLLATREQDGETDAFEIRLERAEPGTEVESLRVGSLPAGEVPGDTEPVEVTIPSGATIPVELQTTLHSASSSQGDTFTMTVRRDFQGSGVTVIPEGSVITGSVKRAKQAERPQSGGVLVLEPVALELDGRDLRLNGSVSAEGKDLEGEGSAESDWKKIAASAGVGGILGGVLEGGKGALAGIVIGGGGAFLATRGEEVELPVGSALTVELTRPVTITRVY